MSFPMMPSVSTSCCVLLDIAGRRVKSDGYCEGSPPQSRQGDREEAIDAHRIESWAKQQNDEPSRLEAIRRLIEFALKAKAKRQNTVDK